LQHGIAAATGLAQSQAVGASPATAIGQPILEIDDLHVHFVTSHGTVRAVEGLSYAVRPGEMVAIVGESGSGKSVSALAVMRLLPPNTARIRSGIVRFEGRELLKLDDEEMRKIRGRDISMIFQEPMTSLNPVLTIGLQIMEPLLIHLNMTDEQANARAIELLTLVGITDPESRLRQYPHQLSGGMRQRVMIAIGLACNPKLLIADEPTTALDVTIQAQILELLRTLQRELHMSVMLITHDLGVVAETASRVAVMYAGQVVEYCDVRAAFRKPLHPYTAGLQASLPKLGETRERLRVIKGTVPNPARFPQGCRFHPRCPIAIPKCLTEPPLEEIEPGRWSRCWRAREIAADQVSPVPEDTVHG
jgi:peptide/nickel transport system ATP-binding protein